MYFKNYRIKIIYKKFRIITKNRKKNLIIINKKLQNCKINMNKKLMILKI